MSIIGDIVDIIGNDKEKDFDKSILEKYKNATGDYTETNEAIKKLYEKLLSDYESLQNSIAEYGKEAQELQEQLTSDDFKNSLPRDTDIRSIFNSISGLDNTSKKSKITAVYSQLKARMDSVQSQIAQELENATPDTDKLTELNQLLEQYSVGQQYIESIKQEINAKTRLENKEKTYNEKFGNDNTLGEEAKRKKAQEEKDKLLKEKQQKTVKTIETIFRVLTEAVNTYYNWQISKEKEAFDVRKTQMEAVQKIATAQIDVVSNRLKRTFSVGLQAFSEGGVNESAYAAASNAIDNVGEQAKFKIDKALTEQQALNDFAIRRREGSFERTKMVADAAKNVLGDYVAMATIGAAIGGVVGAGVGAAIAGITNLIADWTVKDKEMENLRFQNYAKLSEKEMEMQNDYIKKGLEIMQSMAKSINEFGQKIEKYYLANEKIYYEVGRNMGISGQTDIASYNDMLMRMQVQFGWIGGKDSAQKYANMQGNSNETTGFNVGLTTADAMKGMSLGYLIGDENANSITTVLSMFNKTVESGSDIMFEMYKNANKMGLSTRRFAKDIAENLKMAQRYTFEGGVKGIMEMSLWAQKVRFNVQSLNGVLDKMIGGGLEGVIQQSAQLQVLGGAAAMNSSPLAMAYEMLNDPAALAKRLNKITEGIGMFNSATGQAEIRGADMLKVNAIASATGRSSEDIRNEIEQRLKVAEIDKVLQKNYTEEQKNLIYSKAKYNTETGSWQVAVNRNGEMQNVDVNDLTNSEFVELKDTEEQLVDYVKEIRDSLLRTEGTESTGMAMLQASTGSHIRKNVAQRVAQTSAFYNDNYEGLSDIIRETSDFFTKSSEIEYKKFLSSKDVARDYNKEMIKQAMEQTSLLEGDVAIAKQTLDVMRGVPGALDRLQEKLFGLTQAERLKYADVLAKKEGQDFLKDSEYIAKMASLTIESANGNTKEVDRLMKEIKAEYDIFKNFTADDFKKFSLMSAVDNAFTHAAVTNDSFMYGNNTPMMTAASKVTPINDGSVNLVQSHPLDSAIFAKVGGPFDTLFKGVFGQVNAIYNILNGKGNSNMNVNFTGRIELSSNGQSIDLLQEIKTNPQLVRLLTEKIVTQIGENREGGKTSMYRNRYAAT